ncbi:MAG: hypothetical protein JJ974_01700 [Phycisphaerales bacterium]|nr:hypothetical protein [Phycisphaerales bacterium]
MSNSLQSSCGFWIQRTSIALVLGASACVSTSVFADDGPPRVPTLDELLGLEVAPETPDTTEIDRALTAQEAGEAFSNAVMLMGDAATRIGGTGDIGITTQRMQEDIIRMLDQVIESAQNNQGSGSGSSSSSQSSSPQQQPNQQQQNSDASSSGSGEPTDGSTPPGSFEVGSNNLEGARARWGNLPDRLRDALNQGLDEPYSKLYRELTERYYKALAEDEE